MEYLIHFLRFQEIVGALDSELMITSLVPSQNSTSNQQNSQKLLLRQSISLMDCLRSCWADDVLVLSCSDKFLRLFLQLLSRYSSWLSAGLNACRARNASTNTGSEWAISAAPDDFLYMIHDLKCLVEEVCGDYLGHVLELLKSCPAETLDLVKQSILQSGNTLRVLQPLVINLIVETLVEKSVEARKTESSLQKIRLGAQRRAGASSDVSDHNVSEIDKL